MRFTLLWSSAVTFPTVIVSAASQASTGRQSACTSPSALIATRSRAAKPAAFAPAFMSAGAKAAGFAALLRVAMSALGEVQADWRPVLAWLAALTMTVGNVTALLQSNVKRMLAYSSIAHAGYVLVAVTAGGQAGASAALFYLAVYSFMNLGAFGILALLGREQDERVLVADLAGLGFRQPVLGIAMTVFMISLGGIPPTAGFMGKVYVFGAALQAHLIPLVIVGVLNSVVSVFYYLRITVALYMSEEPAGGGVE